MNEAVLDAYVINILPRQITKHIKCLPTDIQAIEQERKSFKEFLLEKFKLGKFYFNQLDAWAVYSFQSGLEDLFEDNSWSESDDTEIVWTNEIKSIIRKSINPANYNEYGGQE
jgi:hypothetical protein